MLVEDVTDGAVNRPVLVIVPAVAFHTTAVFGVDVRVAVNCCVEPEGTVAPGGERAILADDPGVDAPGVDDGAMPPQPVETQAKAASKRAIPGCLKKAIDAAFS
jgi:hypothetical protein